MLNDNSAKTYLCYHISLHQACLLFRHFQHSNYVNKMQRNCSHFYYYSNYSNLFDGCNCKKMGSQESAANNFTEIAEWLLRSETMSRHLAAQTMIATKQQFDFNIFGLIRSSVTCLKSGGVGTLIRRSWSLKCCVLFSYWEFYWKYWG